MDAVWSDSISNNTSDPHRAGQRVFIGNLKPHIVRETLFDIFKKYGEISAISINRNGYGFVQFSTEEAAQRAQEANGTLEKGCSLQVKSCSMNETRKRTRPDRSRSPVPSRSPPKARKSPSPTRNFSERNQSRYPASEDFRVHSGHSNDSSPKERNRRPPVHEESRKPNDCEIVVMSKLLRDYAETVERRLKNLGLKVDVLFMKDEALLAQALDDLTLRGTLYACVIAQQHEVHNSLTLNVLYGVPQEHRNMPVDEALKFLAKNFREHLEKQRDREVGEDEREIKFLLKLVIESRYISIKEYDRLIDYLQMKRHNLIREEMGDVRKASPSTNSLAYHAPNGPRETSSANNEHQQLQDQIRKLIGAPTQGLASVAAPVLAVPPSTSHLAVDGVNVAANHANSKTLLNLNNPRIQEALDQLLKNGINNESPLLNDPRVPADASCHGRDGRGQPFQLHAAAAGSFGSQNFDQRYNVDGFNADQRALRGHGGYEGRY